MEHSQLSQMVTWLDQAHQQDRAELGQLRQQVEFLTGERAEKLSRIGELEAELAAVQGQVDRLSRIESEFERFKEQVNVVLERGEARRQQSFRDSDRLRQTEIENMTKAVSENRRELEKFRRYDEDLAARRVDIQRISGDVSRLQQQVTETTKEREEWIRATSFLEEQRRQDNKRVTDFQSQITEVLKRIETVAHRMEYLENMPSRLAELKTKVEELHQQQNKDLEKMQFVEAQHERQVRTWSEEIQIHRQRMDEYEKRMEQYDELPHTIKRGMGDLHDFQEQMERQQHEMSELQRLAQNHQKNQLEEWQVEEEQRWQKYLVEWERQWNDYDKALNDLTRRVTDLDKRSQGDEKRIHALLQLAEEDAELRAMASRDWQLRFEQIVEEE